MKLKLKHCFVVLGALLLLAAALAVLPYKLIASPVSTIRVVDDNAKPLAGIRISREWETSEGQKSEEHNFTDSNGQVTFERVEFRMSWLKRIAKPLLIFEPSSCGSGWEVYGHAKFQIGRPEGYTFKFDTTGWTKFEATYENRDGIHVYYPVQNSDANIVEFYTFNKRDDYFFTITFSKESKN